MKTRYITLYAMISAGCICGLIADEKKIVIDSSKLVLGYEVLSKDLDASGESKAIVTIAHGRDITDIRARVVDGKYIREWTILYTEGQPVALQVKTWKSISLDGEDLGEGLIRVISKPFVEGKVDLVDKKLQATLQKLIKVARSIRK